MALNDYPILNARMTEDETALIYHDDHNIGVAVDTPHGLLVPNIKVQFSKNSKNIYTFTRASKTCRCLKSPVSWVAWLKRDV